MNILPKYKWPLLLLSGILICLAFTQMNMYLAWCCFVPLFLVVNDSTAKQSFFAGCIVGLVITLFAFYWMIPGAERFTGSSTWYGFFAYVLSCLLFGLWMGITILGCRLVQLKSKNVIAVWLTSIGVAAVFVLGEWMLMQFSAGFPWFDFHAGGMLLKNTYAIQPAAFFGIYVLSFVVVLVNVVLSFFIARKQWKSILIVLALIPVYLLAGCLLKQNFEQKLQPGKAFTVAILAENISLDIQWNDANGNQLVQRLLDLNKQAVVLKPDMVLWSESAIPWTYSPNDDLVNEVLRITAPAHITHIIGINTAIDTNTVFNSAYCFLPDGKMAGRYDKQYLLSLIEKPLTGVLLPFLSSNGFEVQPGQQYHLPLPTPYGKAGIIICNEATVPAVAQNRVNNGAEFLLNMSNDGWFSNTYIVGLHFYNARLRAVENRRDLVVNSNNGICGHILASGDIGFQHADTEPYVQTVQVQPNNYHAMYTNQPLLFVYGSLLCVFLLLVYGRIKKPL